MSQPKGRRPRRPTSTRYARPPKPRAQRRRARAPREVEAGDELALGPAEDFAADAAPRMAYCLDCDAPFSVEDPGRHEGHLSVDLGGSSGDDGADTRGVRSISIGEAAARAEPRWPTGWPGLDRLLGGGLVAHGVYLLSGSPGAGKSTITMQLAASLRRQGAAVLIASGEENESQIGTRAGRLGVELDDPGLRLLATDTFDAVLSEVKALGGTEGDPDVVVVDSAQAMRLTTEPGSLGSVTQVRALGHHAVRLAKSTGRCVVVIAHVTKDGDIAGPQTLVHAVDAWLHLHRDDDDARWLKTPKNRFGPTSEVVALDMGPSGLRETRDPAALLLEDLAGEVGVAVGVAVAGDAAPVLVPVEAFVGDEENGASLASLGFARDRARFLVEALARHANIDLRDRPLRIKIPTIGGTTLSDGGLDLAVCAALLSGYYRVPLPPRWATWGEASLSGVVQRVARPEARVDALRAAVASGSLARVGEAPAPSAPGGWVPLRTPTAPGLALAPIRRLSELALAVSRLPGATALPAATVRVKVPKTPAAGEARGPGAPQAAPEAPDEPPWARGDHGDASADPQ